MRAAHRGGLRHFFLPARGLPPLSIGNYTYTAIPKCYALLDTTALDASGITRLQNQPVLALKGEGVLVGIIDTGVDYTNPLFRYSDGSSRIPADLGSDGTGRNAAGGNSVRCRVP